ncbi:RNA ligase family protein [Stieleria varia]|uniref:RNA ligase n=1 Tax=Stieleria varia TaxID=2528005 RepID=A0A5C5ZZF0_9BACT|nr:RNA ligase family protein [Stieleria varia]TWT92437.1 RNA ligase [Stieleria varia]
MGASQGDFVKYPRTPHLFGSRGTADDRHLGQRESDGFLSDDSLIVEEKIDGTNVGIHFADGQLLLQCRGHLITEGMHPQYDLLKQWTLVKRGVLEERLGEQFILYGEWMYAKHSIYYRELPHYFFEFDIYDKNAGLFLTLTDRLQRLDGSGIETVPIVHRGQVKRSDLDSLIGPSAFGARFDNPMTGSQDNLMEGIYLRTENADRVTGRAKYVRPEFVEKIKQSTHWQQQAITPNELVDTADIWS